MQESQHSELSAGNLPEGLEAVRTILTPLLDPLALKIPVRQATMIASIRSCSSDTMQSFGQLRECRSTFAARPFRLATAVEKPPGV